MEYDKMLDRALSNLPESVKNASRFEIPKVRGHVQGNRTIIANFVQIADVLGREVDVLLKYILRELATPGEMKKNLLIMGSKISSSRINEKIKKFADTYVICKECGAPDTKIIRDNRINFLRCTACGAKYPVTSIR